MLTLALILVAAADPEPPESPREHLRNRIALVDSIIADELRIARRTGSTSELRRYAVRRLELMAAYARAWAAEVNE